MKRVIRAFWTGDNPMSENRIEGLQSMRDNLGVEIEFMDKDAINKMVSDVGVELHPAYKFLSCNHQSDYLRCYVSNYLGGGYADVKKYSKDNNWSRCFDKIEGDKNIWIVGAPEIVGGSPFDSFNRQPIINRLICNGWFIVRENTYFTRKWINRVNCILDANYEKLAEHPASCPRNKREHETGYPLKWADVQGRPFHILLNEVFDPKRIVRELKHGWIREGGYL